MTEATEGVEVKKETKETRDQEKLQADDRVKEQDQPIRQSTRHEQQLEAIAQRRSSQEGFTTEENPVPDGDDHDQANDPEDSAKPEVKMIELYDDDGNVIKVPANAKYRAKINGQEQDVPFEQVARSYQVGAAADRRMEQASARQKQLEAKERELEKKGQELTRREQTYVEQMQSIEKKREEGELSESAYQESAKKLLYAFTESENPEKDIAEILKTIQPRGVDVDRIKQEARQETLAEIERREKEREERALLEKQRKLETERVSANERFEKEYADVIEDPIAYSAARQLAAVEWEKNPNANPWDIAQSVGNQVREWKKSNTPSPEGRKIPTPTPRKSSARAKVGEDPKPKTRGDILAEMKKARGQPV